MTTSWFIDRLRKIKSDLEHTRRFKLHPDDWRRAVTQAEGDIEELLIDYGFQLSDEREADRNVRVTVEWQVTGHSMVSPAHRYNGNSKEGAAAALADYERLIAGDSYLGGKQSGTLCRITTIVDQVRRNH